MLSSKFIKLFSSSLRVSTSSAVNNKASLIFLLIDGYRSFLLPQ